MHPTVLAAVSLSLLSWSSVLAQEPPPANAAATWKVAPFRPLEQLVGGTWLAHWNAATNTPDAIYGTGIALEGYVENSLEEARRHAHRALQTYRDLLQLGHSDFREVIGARMGNAWSFTFEQSFRGLPCIGGRADIRINQRGVLAMLGSTAWQIPQDFDTVPAISQAVATMKAALRLGFPTGVAQPGRAREPRLVIWGDNFRNVAAPFRLAWEIPVSNVDRGGFGPIGRYYIDAKTGGVLSFQSDKHDCSSSCRHPSHGPGGAPAAAAMPVPTTVTVMAWTRIALHAASPLVNTPVAGLELVVPGIGPRVTDQNGQISIDIAAPVQISLSGFDGIHYTTVQGLSAPVASVWVTPGVAATLQVFTNTATAEQAAHANVAHWVHKANEWWRTILGNTTQLNGLDSIDPTVNEPGACNAYYFNNSIHFYPAGTLGTANCNNSGYSTVVVHELGHGLDDAYGAISNNTPDGLSEGWADIMALYLTDQPALGQGLFISGGFGRNGLNSTTYPSGSTDPHTSGESWMGFAWQFREILRAIHGDAFAIALSNDVVVGSIVADATTQPGALLEVFIADDDDGNVLNGVPHYSELSAAASIKTIPFPPILPISMTHEALTDTGVRLSPRVVNTRISITDSGTLTQARLVYSVNGGAAQTRIMQPNGQPDGYRALLPAVAAGPVTYHLEADDSTAATTRLPPASEFSYRVNPPTGAFTPFFFEDFEGVAAGWSHGVPPAAPAGTIDDWQLGTPAGRSGTELSLAWADPSPAQSSRVYGNDLGLSAADGRYPATTTNWLRTPTINCTGRTGVTLRFRRWLTVEQSSKDIASVLVNGTVVWTNPIGEDTIDTAWQAVELAVPMADNNASVRVEWRLVTDDSAQLGGWNIDDVELGTRPVLPLDVTWRWLPEQMGLSTPTTMTVQLLAPSQLPFICGIGETPGPTSIPGIPQVLVGGNIITFTGVTDPAGFWTYPLTSFGNMPVPGGILWFSQVLTLDPLFNLVVSNQQVNWFHQ